MQTPKEVIKVQLPISTTIIIVISASFQYQEINSEITSIKQRSPLDSDCVSNHVKNPYKRLATKMPSQTL